MQIMSKFSSVQCISGLFILAHPLSSCPSDLSRSQRLPPPGGFSLDGSSQFSSLWEPKCAANPVFLDVTDELL